MLFIGVCITNSNSFINEKFSYCVDLIKFLLFINSNCPFDIYSNINVSFTLILVHVLLKEMFKLTYRILILGH